MDLSNPTRRNPKPLLVFHVHFVGWQRPYYYSFPCLLRSINSFAELYIQRPQPLPPLVLYIFFNMQIMSLIPTNNGNACFICYWVLKKQFIYSYCSLLIHSFHSLFIQKIFFFFNSNRYPNPICKVKIIIVTHSTFPHSTFHIPHFHNTTFHFNITRRTKKINRIRKKWC